MEWKSLLFGQEDSHFLFDTFIRTTLMFLIILIGLRMLGKRGIHQLSVFELGVIVGLGSAAGDPMFYKDVGILPSIVVFAVVILMYRLITYMVGRNDRFETFIEGKATYVLKHGVILAGFKNQPLGQDEFFATLRQNQVYHLGQLERVIIESDGQISCFYYPDDRVIYGLPILPDLLDKFQERIYEKGIYSCHLCGTTEELELPQNYCCTHCGHKKCVKAMNGKRIK